ncbi:MAG: hypothetical protein AUK37_04090 [Rhodobacterales bacterium CG2_30_65_12]|nr:MAG: hypothetical protein AUK37_04090 [Rhodobacterales bacterium CG2_30_65_12]
MNVLMFTNTFVPHVGGVTHSILALRGELLRRGHRVLVVAPAYAGHRTDEPGVLRVPAIADAGGTGYALPIPLSRHIRDEVEAFGPDVIHAHHPFLLGDTALRTAASLGVPAVYTFHTRYDHYLGRAAGIDGGRIERLARRLAEGFADMTDAVIAPSESVRALIAAHGVTAPIRVIPTGIDLARMGAGDRGAMRARLGLGADDFAVGHLGRLTEEKNLRYLAEAVALFLGHHARARFILLGHGPMRAALDDHFAAAGVAAQVHALDVLESDEIASFYAAMDVFAFASLSETQGLVVTEAMAAGVPVVALDAPGVREGLGRAGGGRLLPAGARPEAFAAALAVFASLSVADLSRLRDAARTGAARFSLEAMGDGVETLYADLIRNGRQAEAPTARGVWTGAWAELTAEAEIVENILHAIGAALRPEPSEPAP